MAIIFLRTATEHGPRTIVFVATDEAARLLSETTNFDDIAILSERPAYASIAQIVAHRTQELDRELARIKRRNDRRRKDQSNVTKLFPEGKTNAANRSNSKR